VAGLPNQSEGAGRERLVRNVASGWLAHGIALVIGFVMPRLIDESIGRTALGVWDLGWSMLQYLAFSGLGMAAAITHHVARFAAGRATRELEAAIASGLACQLLLALLLGAGLLLLFLALPAWAPATFEAAASQLPAVGVYLGAAVAVTLVGDVAQGVLAGHHRTSWNEYLNISADVALALGMVAVLLLGGGIVGLALVTLLVRVGCETVRLWLAARLVPAASFDLRHGQIARARVLVRFSMKTSLSALQDLFIQQGVRVLLVISAGPAALAVYSRYQTLLRQIPRLMERSLRVIAPITSELAHNGRQRAIRSLRERASQGMAMLALPMVVVFAVFGDDVVALWMGRDYVVPGLAWVLAAMALLQLDYAVTLRILTGLNEHGRITLKCFVFSISIFAVFSLALYPFSPVSAAWAVVVSLGAGVAVPHYVLSCGALGSRPWRHFRNVYLAPLLANLLFLGGMLTARLLLQQGLTGWALGTAAASLLLLAGMYWQFGFTRVVLSRLLGDMRRGMP